jgi:8-oxo-dGTP diphosphatase
MNKLNPNLKVYSNQLRTRICGICIQHDMLLLVRHKSTINNNAFWAPPGGGLNYGETAIACLKREMKEETGLDVKVGRFLFINEFIQPPLHAIEYFFEVNEIDGAVSTGSDPEAEPDKQLIESVEFLSLRDINKIPLSDKHRMLHHLYSLDDLLGMDNHFIR